MEHRAIWLLSDGRSGSTWLAHLLNFAHEFHVEHEPVHAGFTPSLTGLPLLPLPGEQALTSHYLPLFEQIRAGAYRTSRFGKAGEPGSGATGLIIRDIFALLIAPGLLSALDWLRPVLLVRHPVEVAHSKLALAEWDWNTDTERFRADAALMAALPALDGAIGEASNPFRRHVLNWAVGHGWFFAQMGRTAVPVVRYPAPREAVEAQVADILAAHTPNHDTHSAAFDRAFAQRSPTDRPPDERSVLARLLHRPPSASRADLAWCDRLLVDFGLEWLVA